MSTANREAPIAVEKRRAKPGEFGLFPVERWAEEELAEMPQGVRLNAYLTIAVSDPTDEHGRLLTRYMTGIGELFDWLPNTGPGTDFPTATKLRKYILEELGFCDSWPQRDGSIRKKAHSMARDSMKFGDLQICFEMTRTWTIAYTKALTGEVFEPWQKWEDEHPQQAEP